MNRDSELLVNALMWIESHVNNCVDEYAHALSTIGFTREEAQKDMEENAYDNNDIQCALDKYW